MRKLLTSQIYLLLFFLFANSANATETCSCSQFNTYMNGVTQPMYGVSGTVVTAGFDLTNFCPGVMAVIK